MNVADIDSEFDVAASGRTIRVGLGADGLWSLVDITVEPSRPIAGEHKRRSEAFGAAIDEIAAFAQEAKSRISTHRTRRAAFAIVDEMSAADEDTFDRHAWAEGVSNMLVDEWAGLNLEAVLDAVEGRIERRATAAAQLQKTWEFAKAMGGDAVDSRIARVVERETKMSGRGGFPSRHEVERVRWFTFTGKKFETRKAAREEVRNVLNEEFDKTNAVPSESRFSKAVVAVGLKSALLLAERHFAAPGVAL